MTLTLATKLLWHIDCSQDNVSHIKHLYNCDAIIEVQLIKHFDQTTLKIVKKSIILYNKEV